MAIIANIATPAYSAPVPHDSVSVPIAQVLPVPPFAWGFTTNTINEVGYDPLDALDGLDAPHYKANAVHPAGTYLEKSKGQVWPR